jgi:hypothetical protein
MDEFRIPVASKEVVIEFLDGVQTAGLVFIPSSAPDHDGPMRLVEWINGAEDFFPFKVHGGGDSVLINKQNVLHLSAYHDRDYGDYDEIDDTQKFRVRVETPHGHLSGYLVMDVPINKLRALDVMNNERQFVFLVEGGKEVHINKRFIVKAMEGGEGE